jgi:hypothetical protein
MTGFIGRGDPGSFDEFLARYFGSGPRLAGDRRRAEERHRFS